MAVALLLATPAYADPSRVLQQDASPAPAAAQHVQIQAANTLAVRPVGRHIPRTPDDAAADSAPVYSDSHLIWHQTGVASWYGGPRWHGHRTASGARYNQNALTAAHATLPIGTRVRVTLEGTGRSVVVVINDRPGTRRRIIDLSRKAAAELGILNRGVALVTLSRL